MQLGQGTGLVGDRTQHQRSDADIEGRLLGRQGVLEEVARRRQVIVFTHDDRLPEAVRRLRIPGRVLEVNRRIRSVVELRNALDPTERTLEDARAVVRTDRLPEAVARRVVPGLCRLAIEARCADVVRRRRLGRGENYTAVETALVGADRLGQRVALALFDEPDRNHNDIRLRLQERFGRRSSEVFFRANRGAHEAFDGDLDDLVRDSSVLVGDLDGLA